jgi:hypothetical protein
MLMELELEKTTVDKVLIIKQRLLELMRVTDQIKMLKTSSK